MGNAFSCLPSAGKADDSFKTELERKQTPLTQTKVNIVTGNGCTGIPSTPGWPDHLLIHSAGSVTSGKTRSGCRRGTAAKAFPKAPARAAALPPLF